MSSQPPSDAYGERPWVPPSAPGAPPPGQPAPTPHGPPSAGYEPASGFAGPPVRPVADPGPAPKQVRIASVLVFVEAGLSVLAAALLPLQRGYFLAAMRQSMPQQPQPVSFDVAPIVTATIYSSMVFALAGAVLWIVLGVKVRQGRNWARIVVTVLAGLALVSVLVSLIQLISPAHLPIYSYAVSAAGALIDIALLILLWRQPAAGWFNARTAYRRQQRYLRRPS